MRYQTVALAIALITAAVVGTGTYVLWDTLAADSAERGARAADSEMRLFASALEARAQGLRRGAEALLANQEVVAFAGAGGRVPEIIDHGRISRGGADYLLVVGPGARTMFEGGISDSVLTGGEGVPPDQVLLLQGAPDAAVLPFPDGPLLVAGARTGPGTDSAALVLGVRLDATELDALAAPGRTVTLRWLPPEVERSSRIVLVHLDGGRVRVSGPLPVVEGAGTFVVSIDAPAAVVARDPRALAQLPLAALVAGGALAMLGLAVVTRALASGVGDLRGALAGAGPTGEALRPLEALVGRDEVGRAAEAALDAFASTREQMDAAVDEARAATARQLLGEHVIRSMHEGVLVERSDTTCIVCNPAATRLLDIQASAVLGLRGGMTEVLGDDLYGRLRERAAFETSQRVELVNWGSRDLTFDAYLVPELRSEGHSLLVIIRDVTAVLEVEQLKRDVVSVVSHELRTPLTVIGSSLGMVAEAPEELRAQLIDAAERNVRRMRELVDDMLDLARLESDEAAPSLRAEDPAELSHEVVTLLAPQAQARGIRLLEATDGDVPQAISLDRRQVTRAVTNLVNNAIKFSPDGGDVWIVLRGEPGWLHIDVVDAGPGVPPEEHERIFTRFYRATNTRDQVTGTGLGLPIVRRIAELHGGTALILPSEQGGYFRVSLPRAG